MSRSKKGGKYTRQKTALALLEATYEKFKAAKEDKAPWTTTRDGKPHYHAGRSYAEECQRLSEAISHLKTKINKSAV